MMTGDFISTGCVDHPFQLDQVGDVEGADGILALGSLDHDLFRVDD